MEQRTKPRKNFTLNKKTIIFLERMEKETKRTGNKMSQSQLIDMIIEQKCQDPIELLREKAKEYQQLLMTIKDRINTLEEQKKK